MKDFNNELEEYFKFLNENKILVEGILANEKTNEKSKKMILEPKTLREIEVAKVIITYFADFFDLTFDIHDNPQNYNVDFENSVSVKLFVDAINALKNNDEEMANSMKEKLNTIDPKFSASLMYDFFVVFGIDMQEAMRYIASCCGFDFDDVQEYIEFSYYLDNAQEITNAGRNIQIDYENIDMENDEMIDATIKMAQEFHNLCEQGMNKTQDTLKMS